MLPDLVSFLQPGHSNQPLLGYWTGKMGVNRQICSLCNWKVLCYCSCEDAGCVQRLECANDVPPTCGQLHPHQRIQTRADAHCNVVKAIKLYDRYLLLRCGARAHYGEMRATFTTAHAALVPVHWSAGTLFLLIVLQTTLADVSLLCGGLR